MPIKKKYVLCTETKWHVILRFQCSTTCGMGIRNRTVTCITSGSVCPAFNKPESQKMCESPPCITHIGMEQRAPWLYSEWSAKVRSINGKEGWWNRKRSFIFCSVFGRMWQRSGNEASSLRRCQRVVLQSQREAGNGKGMFRKRNELR